MTTPLISTIWPVFVLFDPFSDMVLLTRKDWAAGTRAPNAQSIEGRRPERPSTGDLRPRSGHREGTCAASVFGVRERNLHSQIPLCGTYIGRTSERVCEMR